MVLNWNSFGNDERVADSNAFGPLLQKIGASASDAGRASWGIQQGTSDPDSGADVQGSAVGVPGAPAGSAFVAVTPNYHECEKGADCRGICG